MNMGGGENERDEKGGVPRTSVLLDYNVDFSWTRLVILRVSDSRILSTYSLESPQ